MTPEADFYHGAALARLAKGIGRALCVQARVDIGAGGFEVDDCLLLLVKFSSKRLTPWMFTFPERQVRTCIAHAAARPLMICLVCGSDGIVAVANDAAIGLLGNIHEGRQSWIRAARRPRKMYSVSGLGGDLTKKVADGDFERLAIELLNGPNGGAHQAQKAFQVKL